MKTYIAHYSKLEERLKNIARQMVGNDYTNYSIVDNEPTEDFFDYYYKSSELWMKRIQYSKVYSPPRSLTYAEISLTYKHHLIFHDLYIQDVLNQKENSYSLVLEDDAVFGDDFYKNIDEYLQKTPEDWDFIFLGNGCGLRIPESERKEGQVAYLKDHPATKCTDSFIVKHSAASKLYHFLVPFVLPVDFELNYLLSALDMKVYWWEPCLVTQGSQNGLYKSEIN